jgi:hypothetical protein
MLITIASIATCYLMRAILILGATVLVAVLSLVIGVSITVVALLVAVGTHVTITLLFMLKALFRCTTEQEKP